MIVVIALGVFAIALGTCVMLHLRRTPRELRGDWWPQFERDFRLYAARTAASRDRQRRDRKG